MDADRAHGAVARPESGLTARRAITPQLPMRMADFARRGFRVDRPRPRAELERHARSFLSGYNLAIAHWPDVHEALGTVPAEERGFAYEGAAMYAGQRDLVSVRRSAALTALLAESGQDYIHLIHVGLGWALSPLRLPLRVRTPVTPLLRWLALDGAGFADVFFGGRRTLARRARRAGRDPARLARLAGSGRAMWFLTSADPVETHELLEHAPVAAQAALWSGVGLAATYAGGADESELDTLRIRAGDHWSHLAQGVVFGATARTRAGVVPAHTALACARLASITPETAATWAHEATHGLTERRDVQAYQEWRTRIRLLATESAES
ncbi:DUF1702 family protein [Actinocrispum wychmicini]|uniref:Uncharacterized protein DUF1702 n=1 Tax=Actinocrispum wychmicini TaxID=1213861 RepID=A0A4V2S7F0_9PSEU|nr:DUF1702 family protein [Actinocrispum wychmicini]TCO59660.1 uncharacterized protein DUF1702 [Actinocrispum wychmicini]